MSKLRSILAMAFTLTLCIQAMAQAAPIDGSDPAVRPQDDLFGYVNGAWLKKAEIPADKRSYGTFMELYEQANANVRTLLEQEAAHPGTDPQSRMVGDFFASLMDTESIQREGLKPLQPLIHRAAHVRSLEDVARAMGELQQAGVGVPAEAGVEADEKHPEVNAVYWGQGGLGLPDRDYYLKTGKDAEALRADYLAYLSELNKLAGTPDPEAVAKAALDFETQIATLQWTRVERRDALKTYNPTTRADWKNYGSFPWETFANASGMPADLGSIIAEPTYFKAFADLAAKTSPETWQAYLRTRILDSYASNLDKRFQDAHFNFKSKKLNGLKAQAPLWRRAVQEANEQIGEAIGERYVAKYFPPATKARMVQLVDNLLVVYKQSLEGLTWMTPATRQAAVEKLSKLHVKIGYPDKWRGYQGLVVKRDDAVGNIMRSQQFQFARDMKEAGKPVDHTRWDMDPQVVNAYYNPVGNEIVFPAAILQPPFFDPNRDDALNYGAIGAVIGHEISHGFDDEGRHYDGTGALRDWWTASDEKGFDQRTERLSKQYDGYEALPGEHVNGKLTMGENIADLTGVAMAMKAYHYSLGSKQAPTLDGLTGDQRFFVGYALVWRSKTRPEWMHNRLLTDPHSPEQYRTNGVVTNIDAFYDAFGLKPGDGLYKKPEDRVRIW